MTLADALRRLQAAGKIGNAWQPGMADTQERRVLCSEHADGLVFVDLGLSRDWVGPSYLDAPDLTDPASVGCLLALLREASGNRFWHCVLYGDRVVCEASAGFGEHFFAPTEGEAIAAALIALAEVA